MENANSCIFIIFGGTGDLTHRKLLPALMHMKQKKWLSKDFTVISVGRRDKTSQEYRDEVFASLGRYASFSFTESDWAVFSGHLHYQKVDFLCPDDYRQLDDFVASQTLEFKKQLIFYLAVAPDLFEVILTNLESTSLIHEKTFNSRLIIEKPFGSSLDSAKRLNHKILQLFGEDNAYRIDHYLGKEMVQSLMGIRFANILFEPLWNTRYIDNIQITIGETIGIENRGEYYDKAGALGDMVQNHMLQILSLIAMEPPIHYDHETIRNEKVKVLKAIKTFSKEEFLTHSVFGQYGNGTEGERKIAGYRQEARVAPDSQTESFAALKLSLDMKRWKGVPIYVRTGKRLQSKITMVVVEFRQRSLMKDSEMDLGPNLLIIKIQPKEEVLIQFNTKTPGMIHKICPVRMSYCQNCEVCKAKNASPESYEKLIFDVIKGDSTLFTRWDEVERSWEIIECLQSYKKSIQYDYPNYTPGSWGPDEADRLLINDGRHWWNLEEVESSCGYGISP